VATKKLAKADLVSRGSQKIFAPVRQPADGVSNSSRVAARVDHLWSGGRCPRLIGLNPMRSMNTSALSPQLVGDIIGGRLPTADTTVTWTP